MKYAMITAPNGFGLVDRLGLSYHLALAQHLHEDDYARFYLDKHYHGHFVMVDNGVAEGEPTDFVDVLMGANKINADEVVMPDVLDDMEATLAATQDVLKYVYPRYRAMVPQGTTWAEWTKCLEEMVEMGCRTICVAKRYERLPGGRFKALQIIESMGYQRAHDVHLLGFSHAPLQELMRACHFQWIRGCDSAAPIAYAQAGGGVTEEHESYNWGDSFDREQAYLNAVQIAQHCYMERK